jgi:hypothetical protein
MSVLALFSGLLYKGSYNVEVRRPHVSALPLSRPRARALAPEAPPPRLSALQRRKRRGAPAASAGGASGVARALRCGHARQHRAAVHAPARRAGDGCGL